MRYSRSVRRTSGYCSRVIPTSASALPRATVQKHGYTLIELMIVVAITSVLAAVAIPAFRGYIQKSRTGEATAFLGVIKLRQAAYRGEFGQYAGNGPNLANIAFVPFDIDRMRNGDQYPFPAVQAPGANPPADPFFAIGATPDGAVRFGYGVVAGSPAEALGNGGTNITIAPYNVPATEVDFYFIAQAVTDLDDDGEALIMEATSFAREIWISDTSNGWD